MRVLVAAESFLPTVNGVTNSVVRVLEHLRRERHQAMVLAPAPGPSSVAGTPIERVPGLTVPHYGSMTIGLGSERRIEQALDRFDPDVVHLAAPVVLGAQVGSRAAERDIPTVAVFQTHLSGFVTNYGLGLAARPIWSWLRAVHNRADRTLAPTRTVASELIDRGFSDVGVWGRGVDHAQFNPHRRSDAFRQSVGLRDGELLIGYVGRLAAEKRVELLAPLQPIPGIRLVIIGDGPERNDLQRAMPTARFTGLLAGDRLGEAMASLDVFVHPGPHETYCQAIQEAMAAGVPVVAPAAGGPLDLVAHGETGLLYPVTQPDQLVHAVTTLVDHPELRVQMSRSAHDAVAGRSWSSIGDELLAVYRDLLEGPPMKARAAA